MVPGKRYSVFSIRTTRNNGTIWVRAGVAFVQADDSMNLYLDVLPMEGQLHIRETGDKRHVASNTNQHKREEPAATPGPAQAAESMGGH